MESEVPLLVPENYGNKNSFTNKDALVSGLKRVSLIAFPMVLVSVSQYMLRVVSMMMLGHLGELALSSASIATSLTNVTGFSFIFGLSCALETLCGQAFGAENYKKVGTYCYGAVLWLFLACLPVCLLWIYTEKLLILIGQDPEISSGAGKFSIWLIPSLFPYAILQSLTRFLQTQSLVFGMVISSAATLCIHLPLSWALIFKFELDVVGAALAISFSYWLNVIFLGLYIYYSSSCKQTRTPLSKDIFLTMGEFFQFAIPSAVMVCLEWWTYEIIVLLGGLLSNPQLETSVLSICLTITSLHYLVQYAFATAASTLVSNELGAGKPRAAQLVVFAVVILSIIEFTIAGIILFCCRYVLGYAFSDEKEVIDYVKELRGDVDGNTWAPMLIWVHIILSEFQYLYYLDSF